MTRSDNDDLADEFAVTFGSDPTPPHQSGFWGAIDAGLADIAAGNEPLADQAFAGHTAPSRADAQVVALAAPTELAVRREATARPARTAPLKLVAAAATLAAVFGAGALWANSADRATVTVASSSGASTTDQAVSEPDLAAEVIEAQDLYAAEAEAAEAQAQAAAAAVAMAIAAEAIKIVEPETASTVDLDPPEWITSSAEALGSAPDQPAGRADGDDSIETGMPQDEVAGTEGLTDESVLADCAADHVLAVRPVADPDFGGVELKSSPAEDASVVALLPVNGFGIASTVCAFPQQAAWIEASSGDRSGWVLATRLVAAEPACLVGVPGAATAPEPVVGYSFEGMAIGGSGETLVPFATVGADWYGWVDATAMFTGLTETAQCAMSVPAQGSDLPCPPSHAYVHDVDGDDVIDTCTFAPSSGSYLGLSSDAKEAVHSLEQVAVESLLGVGADPVEAVPAETYLDQQRHLMCVRDAVVARVSSESLESVADPETVGADETDWSRLARRALVDCTDDPAYLYGLASDQQRGADGSADAAGWDDCWAGETAESFVEAYVEADSPETREALTSCAG